ncbi:uncharacterized protein LOC135813022 [Sycon ciliatum]|uniref:uncharacterized protein LOC135813022 n=1 Tax=Sycon ciliatum TaxID=27933 RepID=UPI0031F6F959
MDNITSITCQGDRRWTTLPVCSGQVRVRMRAIALPARTAFTVYYLNGSSTAQVGLGYLPSCRAKGINVGGNAQYLRLTNTDTGAISAERGGFTLLHTAATTLLWNTSAHPTLNPTITGLYRCSSDVGDVTGTYRLNVVVLPKMTSFNAPAEVVNNTMYTLNCTGHGYPVPAVNVLVNGVELPGNDTSNNCTDGVCIKTLSISLDGKSYTPGVTVNITCSVDINQPPFICTSAKTAGLKPECDNAVKIVSQTTIIPVVAIASTAAPSATSSTISIASITGPLSNSSARDGTPKLASVHSTGLLPTLILMALNGA